MNGTWRIGMALGLAILGGEAVAKAQAVGSANGSTSVATPSGTVPTASAGRATTVPRGGPASTLKRGAPPAASRLSASFNRVTTARPGALTANTAKGASTQVPASSTWQAQSPSRSQPVGGQTTSHNYYPGMRIGQYPNANRARISRGRTGMMGMGMMMMPGAGASSRGRVPAGSARHR
jgi:hypothetical protein